MKGGIVWPHVVRPQKNGGILIFDNIRFSFDHRDYDDHEDYKCQRFAMTRIGTYHSN